MYKEHFLAKQKNNNNIMEELIIKAYQINKLNLIKNLKLPEKFMT